MEKYNSILDLINEVESIFEELFLSGLNSVQKETINRIKNIAAKSDNFGFEQAGIILSKISIELEERRHCMHYDYEVLTNEFFKLNLYLSIIKNRLIIDSACETMRRI